MNRRVKDIVGQRFGRLVVQSFSHMNNGYSYWDCLCDCGNSKVVRAIYLKKGVTTSCGCLAKEILIQRNKNNSPIKDISGMKFGRLTVIDFAYTKNNASCWNCKCDCGNTVVVLSNSLQSGNTRSCGCLVKENAVKAIQAACEHNHYGSLSGFSVSRFIAYERGAKQRGLEFDVSIEYVVSLFTGKCAYTGMDITPPTAHSGTASLDRIDPTKGYVEGNLQWVHKDINRMKNKFSEKHFIEMCCKVADFVKK